MDDPLLNCMTGVCCPGPAQVEALTSALLNDGVCHEVEEARDVAKWFTHHFDFAEKGKLRPLVESILRLSKA